MSAINDALRRASSAAKYGAPATALPPKPLAPPPAPAPPVAVPLPPAPVGVTLPPVIPGADGIPAQKRAKGRSKVPWIVAVVLLGLAGAGVGGFLLWKQKILSVLAREKANAGEVTDHDRMGALFGDEKALRKVVENEVGSNAVAAGPKPPSNHVVPPAPKPNPVVVTIAPTPAPHVPTPAPAPAPPPANVRFPALRLQSIYFRTSNPSVMINGKTLYVSDEISGVTVVDIQPANVTLVLSGQTNVLTLR